MTLHGQILDRLEFLHHCAGEFLEKRLMALEPKFFKSREVSTGCDIY